MSQKDQRNRKIGAGISLGIHGTLILAFFFLLAWTEPDPPIPEYGIELNFASSNEIYTDEASESEQPITEEVPEESSEPEQVEESSEEVVSEETNAEPTVETEVTEEVQTEDINSTDVVGQVEETAQETKEQVEQTDPEEKEEVVETKESEEQQEEVVSEEEPAIDERALFKNNQSTAAAESKGSSLDLVGWNWDFLPEPDDKSSENGIIVFQITIDDEGEIIGIKTLQKTVSPVVEKVYRDAVMELTFSRTAENRETAATSTGKITFMIQSN